MKNVAIIGEIHSDGIDILNNNHCKVIDLSNTSEDKFKEILKNVDAIVVRTANLDEELLKECLSLKIVARHGVGYDNVDINFLNNNGIALAITGAANAVSVSEHVMTMFLYLCKLINKSDQLVKKGKFIEKKLLPDFFEMFEKNILILGFGRIGRNLAKKCLGFDSNVYVYDPYVDISVIKENNCKPIDLIEGLKIADFITVHMPINNETRNMIGKNQFSMMKKTSIIVNTARGGIINEKDLIWALTNKEIYGAGLDVYEKEPPDRSNPLFSLDNIVLSPHNAALTLECRKRMSVESCENIVYYLNNKSKLNVNNIVNGKNINLEI